MNVILVLVAGGCAQKVPAVDNNDVTDRELILQALKQIEALEIQNQRQQDRIEHLETRDKHQQTRIEQLATRDVQQQALIELLESQTRNIQVEINQLQFDLTGYKQLSKDLRKSVSHLSTTMKKIKTQSRIQGQGSSRKQETEVADRVKIPDNWTRRNDIVQKRQVLTETPCAFFALLTNSILHAGQHQNIVFDHVETNIGNAYNPHHGVFVAPVNGTYVFSSSILAYNNKEVWCDMVVNGVAHARIYARGTDNRHDQGAATIIVRMNKGDDVTIQNLVGGDAIYGETVSYTMFSGFLLIQDW